jgi:hypothetical protein
MYTLTNDELMVSILDPKADVERLGTRYCTGGYIFQVTDEDLGPLLSGPTYPDSINTFDGQGIPDAFNLSPLYEPVGAEGAAPATALIIGIGLCNLQANRVLEFCDWQIDEADTGLRFATSQAFAGWALDLERHVALLGRTVRSTTRLHNIGKKPIPIRWFPHPFYPQPEGDELCRFNIAVEFPENPGYRLAENGFVVRQGWPWDKGYYQALDHDAHSNLVVLQRHPALGLVAATCSYVPALFPIWGNPRTFSWEPFYERTLAAGQQSEWSIDYHF